MVSISENRSAETPSACVCVRLCACAALVGGWLLGGFGFLGCAVHRESEPRTPRADTASTRACHAATKRHLGVTAAGAPRRCRRRHRRQRRQCGDSRYTIVCILYICGGGGDGCVEKPRTPHYGMVVIGVVFVCYGVGFSRIRVAYLPAPRSICIHDERLRARGLRLHFSDDDDDDDAGAQETVTTTTKTTTTAAVSRSGFSLAAP